MPPGRQWALLTLLLRHGVNTPKSELHRVRVMQKPILQHLKTLQMLQP